MILRDGDNILMGLKKRGFGVGKYNGIGGKLDPNETCLNAAIRETEEEIGVKVLECDRVATIIFRDLIYKGELVDSLMHAFVATKWQGTPVETDEMAPIWFHKDKIPYNKTWVDDEFWMPQVLEGKKIHGLFCFDENYNLISKNVEILPEDLICEIRDSDFGLPSADESLFGSRQAARAILLDDHSRVLMTFLSSRHIYKLAGGGLEPGETIKEALRREVSEEVGYKTKNIIPLGRIIERRAKYHQNNISYGFMADIGDSVGTKLEPDEIAEGFSSVWFDDIDAAILAITNSPAAPEDYAGNFTNLRELAFLRSAKTQLEAKK